MTVEDEIADKSGLEEKKKKKNVMVGIRIDKNDQLLLTWALVKVAEPGDRVVAVHVCQDSIKDSSSKDKSYLDGFLDVYKGLCNVKQLDLTGQVSHGSCVRKALVREAKLCDAMVVVVGTSRQNALGSWASVAKYCAKKLPLTTVILALQNGKVVFNRGFSNQKPGTIGDSRLGLNPQPPLCLEYKENPSNSGVTDTSENENSTSQVVQTSEDGSRKAGDESEYGNLSLASEYTQEIFSSSISGCDSIRDDSISVVHEDKEEVSSDSISEIVKELPETTPGWPLLKRATTVSPDPFKGSEARNMSVVQWAMSLPNSKRDDSISVVHEDKEVSSDSNSEIVKELPETTPGWPLLKRETTVSPDVFKGSEARNMSVVQWAMSLPNRIHYVAPETQTSICSDKRRIPSKRHVERLSSWGQLPEELAILLKTNSSWCRWFNHKELKNATSQFSSENLIGKGGCSRVYKGCLPGGKLVAVKILKVTKETWNDFLLEIDIISSLKHKHIVPLIGICLDENDIILVYDFLSRGSLEDNLHGNGGVLSWEVRFNVAIGIAEAINYLHKERPRPVIHRDIKSSNILLSDEFEPQLSDFGLAMWAPSSSYETHSDVVGTFGYLAPEYFMYGKVSEKIDVYSFGVVLLELLSGRRTISTETPKGQESLVMWAKPILENGDIMGILDPNLNGKFDEVQMRRMVLAVTLCITRIARLRPKISEILRLLLGEKGIEEWVNSVNDRESGKQDGDEAYPDSNAESYLDLAMLDVDDDTTSFSSIEQNCHHTFEDYLKGRWSRSSSFN